MESSENDLDRIGRQLLLFKYAIFKGMQEIISYPVNKERILK